MSFTGTERGCRSETVVGKGPRGGLSGGKGGGRGLFAYWEKKGDAVTGASIVTKKKERNG